MHFLPEGNRLLIKFYNRKENKIVNNTETLIIIFRIPPSQQHSKYIVNL
jgi:hypothetical protein